MKKHHFLLLSIFINYSLSFSQNKINENDLPALIEKSYDYLFKQYQSKQDTTKAKTHALAFLLKAKMQKDTSKIVSGYRLIATLSDTDKALIYLDSVIDITKNTMDFRYPAQAYLHKANILSHASLFKEQMEQLTQANIYANARGNIDQQYEIKYFIALLKNGLKDYKESKIILKDVVSYYKKKHEINSRYNRLYNTALFAYGDVLNSLKELDSAEIINKKTIRLILNTKDSLMYDRLLLSSAVTHYLKKEYQPSLDSIKKFEANYTRENSSLGMIVSINVYLAKNYLELNNKELAEKYLLKADSIIFSENYFFPDYRENSESLVQFYKEEKNIKKQLYYIDRLLTVDSILDKNKAYISKHINEDYTTPNLLLEKDNIIKSLKKRDTTKKLILVTLSLFSVLLIGTLYRNNKKKKLYKKRIEELNNKTKPQSYTVDDETTKRILDQLYNVENSGLFLNKDFNLNFLAKKLDTNTAYLSKIINQHKEKTFKQYLVELRIKTLLKNLDEDPMMRKYSIEALAESIGYTNASSFTRIFKNYLGESPSVFLKKKYSERKT